MRTTHFLLAFLLGGSGTAAIAEDYVFTFRIAPTSCSATGTATCDGVSLNPFQQIWTLSDTLFFNYTDYYSYSRENFQSVAVSTSSDSAAPVLPIRDFAQVEAPIEAYVNGERSSQFQEPTGEEDLRSQLNFYEGANSYTISDSGREDQRSYGTGMNFSEYFYQADSASPTPIASWSFDEIVSFLHTRTLPWYVRGSRYAAGGDIPTTDGHIFVAGQASLLSASVVSAVPEPETYLMFLAGLASLGFLRQRRS